MDGEHFDQPQGSTGLRLLSYWTDAAKYRLQSERSMYAKCWDTINGSARPKTCSTPCHYHPGRINVHFPMKLPFCHSWIIYNDAPLPGTPLKSGPETADDRATKSYIFSSPRKYFRSRSQHKDLTRTWTLATLQSSRNAKMTSWIHDNLTMSGNLTKEKIHWELIDFFGDLPPLPHSETRQKPEGRKHRLEEQERGISTFQLKPV